MFTSSRTDGHESSARARACVHVRVHTSRFLPALRQPVKRPPATNPVVSFHL